jgi:serine/threonine-protein kinase
MAARILALIVFLAVAGIVSWFALVHTVHRGTMAVPDLRGTSVEEAREAAYDLGIQITVEEPGLYSASIPAGAVAAQRPHAGFQVKSGASVVVRLSLGNERVEVPDVRGESLQAAVRSLERLNLTAGAGVAVVGHAGPDQVIATGPPAASRIPPGAAVDILVNTTPRHSRWVMPSLLSRNLRSVKRFCSENGLRLGQIHEVSYPGLAGGMVLRQYPPAGSPLSKSDIISLWVSR